MREKMKRLLTLVLCFAVITTIGSFAAGARPNRNQQKLPSSDEIISKYVEAIGGEKAVKGQTSRVSKGSIEIAAVGLNGTAEVYEKAPNKTATIVNITNFGMVQEGFDGKTAWSKDPQMGLRDKEGGELAAAKLDSEFYKSVKLKELYPKLVVKGTEKVGDKDTYVVEATPTESSVETWYFDTKTGLLIRQDSERDGPMGKQKIQTFLEDYKKFDGINLPSTIRQVTPQFTVAIKINEVQHNVAIDEAKFKKPAQ
jgi:outer membrane lipoprotein-sorting protein